MTSLSSIPRRFLSARGMWAISYFSWAIFSFFKASVKSPILEVSELMGSRTVALSVSFSIASYQAFVSVTSILAVLPYSFIAEIILRMVFNGILSRFPKTSPQLFSSLKASQLRLESAASRSFSKDFLLHSFSSLAIFSSYSFLIASLFCSVFP